MSTTIIGVWLWAGGGCDPCPRPAEPGPSTPYFGGRGAIFGQGNIVRKGPVRPFVLAGVGFGESAGPMFGGGVEIVPGESRIGFRVAVDYLARVSGYDCGLYGCGTDSRAGRPYTGHQVTVRVGLLFR